MSEAKKILFIITQSEMGGAQRFLLNLLSHILHQADPLSSKNGGGLGTGQVSSRYEIMVATGSDGGGELADKLKSLNIEISTLENLKRDVNPINDIKAVFEIRKLIETFKPDTLFLLSSKAGFIGSLATCYMLHTTRPRVIYRIGGWTFNDPWPRWKKKLWVWLERLSAPWKDIIIVNNQHDLEQASQLGIKPRGKLVLIHNGIDPYKLEFLPRDEARVKLFEKTNLKGVRYPSFKVPDPLTIIGTVANFYRTKGIEYLIEAAEYFKNNEGVVFVVIGDGPLKKELVSSIKYYGLEKKVFLLGQLTDGYKYMPAFDVFVLPSVKEGFPWAIIEAMSAKLPVVATRVGAVPEIIENGRNGFIVEPHNPAALAAKIKELLASDHLYKEFSIQGHQTVLFNFSEDKMLKEVEALL